MKMKERRRHSGMGLDEIMEGLAFNRFADMCVAKRDAALRRLSLGREPVRKKKAVDKVPDDMVARFRVVEEAHRLSEVPCPVCRGLFIKQRAGHRYCSPECRMRYNRMYGRQPGAKKV